MKTKILLFLLCAFSLVNAQITWDFKTGVEGWGAYGGDIALSWDNSENLVCNYQIAGNYPTIYNDQPLNVANANFFYMKFTATNWPKTSVLVNIYFEMGGNNYYANQTMNVASGEFQFNIRTEVQHAWSVLPATGTTSRIRIEVPHNSEVGGSNWSTASLKIDKIAFASLLTTGLSDDIKSDISAYFSENSKSVILKGADNCPVKIYDVTGKLVESIHNYTAPIKTQNINNGIYILKILSDNQIVTRKINVN